MSKEQNERRFWQYVDSCALLISTNMPPDTKITIIARAPEALPCETLISFNGNLYAMRNAPEHFEKEQNTCAGEKA